MTIPIDGLFETHLIAMLPGHPRADVGIVCYSEWTMATRVSGAE